jgi:hypothetical protein
MYLFDLEDYNCNEVPTDWEDYANGIRATINAYVKCISRYIRYNSSTLPASIVSELNSLLVELNAAKNEATSNLLILIDTLINSPLNCFNKTTYTTYMGSYSEFKSIAKQIDILLTTGGEDIGIQPDIEVSSTTIYPTDGITKPKTTKCVGVYMKQMDNGSEFIGKVTVDNPNAVNSNTGAIGDGFINRY